MPPLGFLMAEQFLEHDPGAGHPENPHRLEAIWNRLDRQSLLRELRTLEPKPASEEALQAVHPPPYLERLSAVQEQARESGTNVWIDSDTACGPNSGEIARLAAGSGIAAVDAVMQNEVGAAFCALRPPGHHAEPDRAMGFCLLNNVAVAARHLVSHHGLERVLVLDWDVHHGNGTQAAFYEDPSVYYISLHQGGIYPGTGHAKERGAGNGVGTNLNVLLDRGDGDAEVLEKWDRIVAPEVDAWGPQFVLISAGFDAHRDDPLAEVSLTRDGFEAMTRRVSQWARDHAGGRLVSMLEGGYNLEALATSVEGHLVTLQEWLTA